VQNGIHSNPFPLIPLCPTTLNWVDQQENNQSWNGKRGWTWPNLMGKEALTDAKKGNFYGERKEGNLMTFLEFKF
jgi:hypothetical protein